MNTYFEIVPVAFITETTAQGTSDIATEFDVIDRNEIVIGHFNSLKRAQDFVNALLSSFRN